MGELALPFSCAGFLVGVGSSLLARRCARGGSESARGAGMEGGGGGAPAHTLLVAAAWRSLGLGFSAHTGDLGLIQVQSVIALRGSSDKLTLARVVVHGLHLSLAVLGLASPTTAMQGGSNATGRGGTVFLLRLLRKKLLLFVHELVGVVESEGGVHARGHAGRRVGGSRSQRHVLRLV